MRRRRPSRRDPHDRTTASNRSRERPDRATTTTPSRRRRRAQDAPRAIALRRDRPLSVHTITNLPPSCLAQYLVTALVLVNVMIAVLLDKVRR